MDKSDRVLFALGKIHELNDLARFRPKFKSLDIISSLCKLFKLANEEGCRYLEFDNGDLMEITMFHCILYESSMKANELQLKSQKRLDFINKECKRFRKSAISILQELESLGLVDKTNTIN